MAHPHNKAVANMNPASLIGVIEESKMTYVRENLSVFLHESQVKLLKQVRKHQKPHHKRIRHTFSEDSVKTRQIQHSNHLWSVQTDELHQCKIGFL